MGDYELEKLPHFSHMLNWRDPSSSPPPIPLSWRFLYCVKIKIKLTFFFEYLGFFYLLFFFFFSFFFVMEVLTAVAFRTLVGWKRGEIEKKLEPARTSNKNNEKREKMINRRQ